jgi:hypothetical protein
LTKHRDAIGHEAGGLLQFAAQNATENYSIVAAIDHGTLRPPMSYVLLTGAGFSRNWGGWLAYEAFEYLLGCLEITPVIRNELWRAKINGSGFEGALDALRALYATYKDERHETELRTFEGMLFGMFDTMNSSYATIDHFEPGRNPTTLGQQPTLVRDFLCRFDKIFTLNWHRRTTELHL